MNQQCGWKKIPDWPYEANRDGGVRRIGSKLILKPQVFINTGYIGVHLYDKGRTKFCLVHRLVLLAFVGPPPKGNYAGAHYDGDRANNCLSNLRWATYSENAMDKHRHGTMPLGDKNGAHTHPEKLARGETHPRSKFTELKVRKILLDNRPNKEIASDYGVWPGAIWNIKNRKNWAHVIL